MTISIYRYSHLALALVSGLFLLVASVTGIILAVEPIEKAVQPYKPAELSELTLAETLKVLDENFEEVLSIEIDKNGFTKADVVTKTGTSGVFYINPKTGELLGKPTPQKPIYQFATNLHRSLFLKSTGRLFVAIFSFLLIIIAITGLILIIKRQGGILKLFSKVQPDYFALQYHVVLGRWFLLPIIIIAATGVYLSAEKFNLLPNTKVSHSLPMQIDEGDMTQKAWNLPLFKKQTLANVKRLTFPFSEFPEDYFELHLKDKELYIHQYTGEILSEQTYPLVTLWSKLSFNLHTGNGSVIWSLVLLLSCLAILFFVFSGIYMWLKRLKNTKHLSSSIDKDLCSHIILVGSETG